MYRILCKCCAKKKLNSCYKAFFLSFCKATKSSYEKLDDSDLAPPTNLCCMSGCANCVWIQHAEKLIKHYQNSEESRQKIFNMIDKDIQDESLKAYLKFEINIMLK